MKIKCLPEFDAPDASQAPDKFLRRDLAEAVSQVILLGGGGVDQRHEDGQLGEAGAGNQLAEHQVKLVLAIGKLLAFKLIICWLKCKG